MYNYKHNKWLDDLKNWIHEQYLLHIFHIISHYALYRSDIKNVFAQVAEMSAQ